MVYAARVKSRPRSRSRSKSPKGKRGISRRGAGDDAHVQAPTQHM